MTAPEWPFLLVYLAGVVLQLCALVDAVRRPSAQLKHRGGKALWVVLLTGTVWVPGAALALVYLLAVPRPGRTTAR